MELKNAGFENTDESRKEAMKRMIDGERFHYDGCCMYLSESSKTFRLDDSESTNQPIIGMWDHMPNWQVEVDWKAELSPDNPRWCEVESYQRGNLFLKVTGCIKKELGEYVFVPGNYKEARPVSADLAALLDAEIANG